MYLKLFNMDERPCIPFKYKLTLLYMLRSAGQMCTPTKLMQYSVIHSLVLFMFNIPIFSILTILSYSLTTLVYCNNCILKSY